MVSEEDLRKVIVKWDNATMTPAGVTWWEAVRQDLLALLPQPLDPETLARALITQHFGVPIDTPLCQAGVDYGPTIGVEPCDHPLPCPKHPNGK